MTFQNFMTKLPFYFPRLQDNEEILRMLILLKLCITSVTTSCQSQQELIGAHLFIPMSHDEVMMRSAFLNIMHLH